MNDSDYIFRPYPKMVYPTGRVSAEDGVIVQDEEEEARVMDGAQVPTAKGKKGKKK